MMAVSEGVWEGGGEIRALGHWVLRVLFRASGKGNAHVDLGLGWRLIN